MNGGAVKPPNATANAKGTLVNAYSCTPDQHATPPADVPVKNGLSSRETEWLLGPGKLLDLSLQLLGLLASLALMVFLGYFRLSGLYEVAFEFFAWEPVTRPELAWSMQGLWLGTWLGMWLVLWRRLSLWLGGSVKLALRLGYVLLGRKPRWLSKLKPTLTTMRFPRQLLQELLGLGLALWLLWPWLKWTGYERDLLGLLGMSLERIGLTRELLAVLGLGPSQPLGPWLGQDGLELLVVGLILGLFVVLGLGLKRGFLWMLGMTLLAPWLNSWY